MKIKPISAFFPAYNEEKNIKKTVTQAIEVLEKLTPKYEVIVVNDGSTDKTGEIVGKLIQKNPKIRMITHSPNRGYGGALKSGLYAAKYSWIVFTDSDGQFDFREIKKFLAKINKSDLVVGYRLKRQDPALRVLIASLLKVWNFLFFGLWLKDADCGFKLIKKEVVDKIDTLKTESAITETEFLVRAKRAGFKMVEVPVCHYPRQEGKQTGGDLRVIFKAAKESLGLWKSLRES